MEFSQSKAFFWVLIFLPFSTVCISQKSPEILHLFNQEDSLRKAGNCDSTSVSLLERAIAIAKKEKDLEGEFHANYRLAFFFALCDPSFKHGFSQSLKTLELAEKIGDPEFIGLANNSLGALHFKIKEYSSAENYYWTVIKAGRKIPDEKTRREILARGYINLIEVQIKLAEEIPSQKDNKLSEALQHLTFFKDSIYTIEMLQEDSPPVSNYKLYWRVYRGLIHCIQDSTNEKGLILLDEALAIANKQGIIYKSDTYYYFGKGLNYSGEFKRAIDSLNQGLSIGKDSINDLKKIEILRELDYSYSNIDSIPFLKKAISYDRRADELEATLKSKHAISQYYQDYYRDKEKLENEKIRTKNLIIIICILLILFSTVFLISKNKNNKKLKISLEEKDKAYSQLNTSNQELNDAYAKLDITNHSLNESLIAKQTFISVLAHQSKGRIDTLKNQVSAFKRKIYPNLDSSRQTDLDLISEFTIRLSNTFHNLLVWARPSAGADLPMKKEKLNLKLTFGENSEFGREVNREGKIHNIAVSVNLDAHHDIFSDGVFTTVILRNVTENAIKYSNCKNLWITSLEKGNSIKIVIEDDGVGIPPAKLNDDIFEFDAPLDDNRRANGFGLKICNKLARQQGGKIALKAREAGGTSVIITCDKYKDDEQD